MDTTFALGLIVGAAAAAAVAWMSIKLRDEKAHARLQAVRGELYSARATLDEAALEHAAAEALVDRLPAPLYLVDGDLVVLRGNAAGASMIDKDITGRDFSEGFRQPELIDAITGVIETGEGASIRLEFPVPVERAYLISIAPIAPAAPGNGGLPRQAHDSAPAALIMMLDITLVLRTEQLRADFVANVSHELRTPLSSLIGFIETLRGPARDDLEAQDRFLGIMQEQADRMYRLIADLLSLSRIEMEEHSTPQDKVNLNDVIQKVIDGLTIKAMNRGMTVTMDMADRQMTVQGDEDQLTQVFQNLIDNALKYGEKQSEVKIAGVESGERVTISVRDHGAGIPREHLPRLTERFYRVDAARSRELGGTGLGLAIVKHIVNRHRGKLTVTSEPGDGSTFTISMPKWKE